jgi:GNAT superfamily N-acetyltransferase
VIDPVVREFTAADEVALDELAALARESIREARGGSRWIETHPMPNWNDFGVVALVADLDEVVVGYLVARIGGDQVMTVDEVFVLDQAREVGFGDALVAEIQRIARERGARRLEAEALPGDRDTKNLWERAGITARLITVSVDL